MPVGTRRHPAIQWGGLRVFAAVRGTEPARDMLAGDVGRRTPASSITLILAAGLTRAPSSDEVGFPAVAGFGDFP